MGRDATGDDFEIDDVVEFGEVLIARQASETFTVRNLGDESLDVSGIDISRDVSDYELSHIDSLPTSVLPGGSIQFQISCQPNLQETVILGVSIANSDPDENPFAFAVRAFGVYKPVIEVHLGSSSGELLSDGDTVYADPVSVGTDGYTTFFVSNAGNEVLWLQSVTTDSEFFQPFDFSETYIDPTPPSGRYQEIRFHPTSAGTHQTDVAFGSDDPDTPLYYIHLVGTAN